MLLGTVTVTEALAARFDAFYRLMEPYAAPEDCSLALRGLRTLPVRLRQHERSALEIATWLEGHPEVDQVLHPALPSHPEHHLWRRDFTGSSGLFGFTLKREPSPERLAACINSLKLFGIGFSWGGFQSLVTAGRPPRTLPSRYEGRTIIRLAIGSGGSRRFAAGSGGGAGSARSLIGFDCEGRCCRIRGTLWNELFFYPWNPVPPAHHWPCGNRDEPEEQDSRGKRRTTGQARPPALPVLHLRILGHPVGFRAPGAQVPGPAAFGAERTGGGGFPGDRFAADGTGADDHGHEYREGNPSSTLLA